MRGFGFDVFSSILLQMPSGGVQILFLVVTSFLASRLRNARVLLMIFNTTVAMVGMVLVYCLKDRAGRMSAIVFAAAFAVNIPLSLSLVTSNVAGFTKKSTVSAILFISYCLGNIAGPQFYLARQAPQYKVSHERSRAPARAGH